MWYYESVFYQIYPFGFCGAPNENNGVTVPRIKKIKDWIPHFKQLSIGALYICPLFESDQHGYDTRDYTKLDCRLGTNEDLKEVCEALHEEEIRVVLDGVFNHVGRGFWAFRDVLEKKWESPYKDWFHISFDGNSNYNDGFWYEGWEGHYELVKLNLKNPEVVSYLLNCVGKWMDEFKIDGIRLDVAYMVDKDFMKQLRNYCLQKREDFFLIGEMIHGDYNQLVNNTMLHSATNYECYKGLYSSFNSMNLFEIGHSLLRQFGPENWTLYRGKHLLCFADNHDVTRVASILTEEQHLPLLYGLLFSMPGIPCIYYGSEWGAKGEKKDGDASLRPCFEQPKQNELTQRITQYANAHRNSKALCYGDFKIVLMTNKQLIFERKIEGDRVLVAINIDSKPFVAHFNANAGCAIDLVTGKDHDFGGGSELKPYSVAYWKTEV